MNANSSLGATAEGKAF